MKILITGGAGFIGSHIADLCLERGHQVIVVDNLSTGKRENLPSEATFYHMDVRHPDFQVLVAHEKPDVLNHQAAQVSVAASVRCPLEDAEINIMGSLAVLEACRATGVKQVVFASSGGTMYGEVPQGAAIEEAVASPMSPYGISKAAAEAYLMWSARQHGFKAVSLRYANVYGPRQDPYGEAGVVAIFGLALLEGRRPTINGDGEYVRDYVYGRDVAEANLVAMERGLEGAFNVGTGVGTSVNELFREIQKVVGSSIQAWYGPPRPGDLRRNVLSYEKLKSEFQDGPRDTS